MSSSEKRSLTIRFPEFHWKFFTSFKFLLSSVVAVTIAVFSYWYVTVRPFLWIENGRIGVQKASHASNFSGRIKEMGPKVGEEVQFGQTLFTLDTEFIQAKISQLQIAIDGVNHQIKAEQIRMDKAMEDYLQVSQEIEMGFGSPDQVTRHLEILEEAQKNSEKGVLNLSNLQAERDILTLQKKEMSSSAPFNAVVLERHGEVGSHIVGGQPIYTLYDPTHFWIEANIPEIEISKITLETVAKIEFPAFPNKKILGKVVWIGPAASDRGVPIKVSLENLDFPIKPGYTAKVGLKIR